MANDEKLTDLLVQLKSHLDPQEFERVVVFGSSAIALHGVPLGRDIDDLDVFVSPDTFSLLAKRLPVSEKNASEGGTIQTIKIGKIEILQSFPGVEFEPVFAAALPTASSHGFRVGSLDALTAWKTVQGREKDRKDLEAIERYKAGPS
ncbi:MAG: hypothetical protein JNK84_02515 [Phreatobacter sp.]|uniref:hypothetical protein n=1 Tax=Phreatobacter sp. TaxID=1966341 RepID=UPI001A624192|nr:hypothetical protein [Phreatobacter sp.]MBL8567935.1 hypothetical protein [Phreatobacter sp.]